MTVVFIIYELLFAAAPPAILVWVVHRWWQTSPRIVEPPWGSYLAIAAIILLGLSQMLWLVSAVWAAMHGGAPYNSLFQWIGALGFFATLAGLLAGFLGNGTMRWPACGLSIFMMFSWFVLGLAVSDL